MKRQDFIIYVALILLAAAIGYIVGVKTTETTKEKEITEITVSRCVESHQELKDLSK